MVLIRLVIKGGHYIVEKKFIYLALGFFLVILLVGCASSNADSQSEVDDYNKAREAAWIFIDENGWNDTAKKENWQNAEVTTVIANSDYELLDSSYEGEEALAIVFEEKENAVVAPPKILVDAETSKVVGYMPSE